MRGIVSFVLPCLLLIACTGPGQSTSAQTQGGYDLVSITPVPAPRARMAPAPIPALYKAPEGKGPFPAVILLHGCGGRGPRQLAWAHRLNSWGYAAIIPDSLAPRSIASVCDPGAQPFVTPRDRISDIASTAAWLRARPDIDPNRIAVVGASHGGATAALAVQRIYQDLLRLRASVDYYGRCGDASAQGTTPLLALAGEADDWGNPAADCRAFGQRLQPGAVFEVHTYPGVHHAFDQKGMEPRRSAGHLLEYNEAASEDSIVHVRAFLDRWVAP